MSITNFCAGVWRSSVLFLTTSAMLSASVSAYGQSLSSGLNGSFSNAQQIGTQGGVITQMAFDPNDPNHLYVATWFSGVVRYDYSEGGVISNGTQVVDASAMLNANGANGSYGIAFHDDPTLGSVMYLSRAMPNTPTSPRGQGLGSIVRVTDTNGDGTWGNASDVNQTIAQNIYVADWTHQINQFAIHNNSLYVNIGSMTANGGLNNSVGNFVDPGEAAHTGSTIFIQDLTQLSGDTTTSNTAWFDIEVADGQVLSAADVTAYKSDTQVFASTDPGKFQVFSTGFRNNYGIAVNNDGEVYVSNNEGGTTPADDDDLFLATYQSDHGFAKQNDVVGDWKDENGHASAQAADAAGYFQNIVAEVGEYGVGTAVTGLDFVNAPDNDFDGYIVLARHSNGGQDVILIDPTDGSFQNLLDRQNGVRPTDVLTDPYGDLLVGYSTNQIRFIEVTGGVPEPGSIALLGGACALLLRRRR